MNQESRRPNENIVDRSDYFIGGSWGARVQWFHPEQFSKPFTDETLFDVVGWETPRPQKGQFLCGQFERSWMRFEFVEVDYKRDPPDMFFAKVRIVEQVMK